MERRVIPQPLGGTVAAISSKSQVHRLLIAAALADRQTRLNCVCRCADTDATVRCLTALGAAISYSGGGYDVTPIKTVPREAVFDCGESGATLRFLLPIAAALGVRGEFHLHGRLPVRPITPLLTALTAHGCTLTRPTADSLRCEGRLRAGGFALPGNISSQFITGLLLALPLLPGASDIMLTTPCVSAGYPELTLAVLQAFGVPVAQTPDCHHIVPAAYRTPGCFTAEGDWSNAAFWLCAGAISKPVTVTGLKLNSLQGDRRMLSLLSQFGADVDAREAAVTVFPSALHGLCVDVSDTPDLAPPLALLAACAEGESCISGASRLRDKESDRLQGIADAVNALGGCAQPFSDGLRISGGRPLRGGTVNASNDHRIAMLAAVAASVCSASVTVLDAEATDKSDPAFWQTYAALQQEEPT